MTIKRKKKFCCTSKNGKGPGFICDTCNSLKVTMLDLSLNLPCCFVSFHLLHSFLSSPLEVRAFLLWLASHQWSSFVQFDCNWGSPASFSRDRLRRSGTAAGVIKP